jgi:hypothetical protein
MIDFDFTNFEKINEEAYIWRGFLDSDFTDELFKESEDLSNSENKEVRPGDRVQLLNHIVDPRVVEKVNFLFKDTKYEIKWPLHWHVPRDVWFAIHRDEEAPDKTPFKKAWGLVIYLSDMDGGELFYPVDNTFVKPGKGDLVMHTAQIAHGAVGVNGDNKRFITFVGYDTTIPVDPNKDITSEEEARLTWDSTMNSDEWLKSEIGAKWRAEYKVGPEYVWVDGVMTYKPENAEY